MKIIIIEAWKSQDIAESLVELDDSFSIGMTFSTDENILNKYEYFLDIDIIETSYKNNALITVYNHNNICSGLSYDEWENNNIFILTINQFNLIPSRIFNNYDILVVWNDTPYLNNLNNVYELNSLQDRLQKHDYMYFVNNEICEITNAIYKYCTREDERTNIINIYK